MSSIDRELTTTSYAILGLLAVRPWSTYELAAQMRRNLHYFWPRAESNLYAEPKRLLDGGFARADARPVGLRRRTVYSITPKGRRALARWLGTPAAETRLECETLVKLMFANHGSQKALLENLGRFRAEAAARRDELRALLEEHLAEDGPFPERLHVNVLAFRFLWDHAEADARWADWAIREVERWDGVADPGDRRRLLRLLSEAVSGGVRRGQA
jgi:DNA-binding PadR family transcriptional regulator